MAGAQDILALSDDAFLNTMPPEVVEERTPEPVEQEQPVQQQEEQAKDPAESQEQTSSEKKEEVPAEQGQGEDPEQGKEPEPKATDKGTEGAEKSDKPEGEKDPAAEGSEPKTEAKTAEDGEKKPEDKADTPKPGEAPKTEDAPLNYEEIGKLIMKPFKANGKDITLKSPEEALRLMQMGANYTRKLQDLQPARTLVRMLESNGLNDPARLSYLIDLDKKNPEAIKKLILESGIDPLTIDTTVEPAYVPGNYQPSQEEDRFRTALEEINSQDGGQETVRHIHENWDSTSKNALWAQPEVLTLIHEQRANGIYDAITAELERRKILGEFTNTPFLQAYTQVGDQLAASGGFQGLVSKQTAHTPQDKPEPKVLDTRVATPAPTVTNGDKAQAASPTKTTPTTAKQITNPLSMSDDDFLKSMNQRL